MVSVPRRALVVVVALAAACSAPAAVGVPSATSQAPAEVTFVPVPTSLPRRVPAPVVPARRTVLDAAAFAQALRDSTLPVAGVRVLTAQTDPNGLLAKPGQYNGKVYWTDERAQTGQPTAEIFPDEASLLDRFIFLDGLRKTTPGAPYMFRNDETRVLLRVPASLTEAQAREYEAWLATLVAPWFVPNDPQMARAAEGRA